MYVSLNCQETFNALSCKAISRTLDISITEFNVIGMTTICHGFK
ncbi:unnamed protein product [Schistosoma margrebowiei]|uniref:Uncharacterized protein n=1 Tax=Schistosoma margrebowiei TaxID=48269 RepID=A0A3P8ICV4_9TREM|nr:unnamed protein product [Schistosoma margrebowiei]